MTVLRGSALALTCLVSACAVDEVGVARQDIIAGQASDPGEFPATGQLVIEDTMVCTATLIAPDVAITAAHCLDTPAFGRFGFTLDADDGDGTDNIIPVSVWHRHPEFDDRVEEFLDLSVRNDLGVILLERPILEVTPEQIAMPAEGELDPPGTQLALVGYGRTVWHLGGDAVKRDAQVVVDRAESHEFSTTASGPQACNGDSGGPLFADTPKGRRLVGLVSRAVGDSAMCDTGAIMTRVQPYADWIYLASHDRSMGGCSAGGGSAALPFGLAWVIGALRRRRRGAR
jgi:uncharacterized protein (TIGR03382 family)